MPAQAHMNRQRALQNEEWDRFVMGTQMQPMFNPDLRQQRRLGALQEQGMQQQLGLGELQAQEMQQQLGFQDEQNLRDRAAYAQQQEDDRKRRSFQAPLESQMRSMVLGEDSPRQPVEQGIIPTIMRGLGLQPKQGPGLPPETIQAMGGMVPQAVQGGLPDFMRGPEESPGVRIAEINERARLAAEDARLGRERETIGLRHMLGLERAGVDAELDMKREQYKAVNNAAIEQLRQQGRNYGQAVSEVMSGYNSSLARGQRALEQLRQQELDLSQNIMLRTSPELQASLAQIQSQRVQLEAGLDELQGQQFALFGQLAESVGGVAGSEDGPMAFQGGQQQQPVIGAPPPSPMGAIQGGLGSRNPFGNVNPNQNLQQIGGGDPFANLNQNLNLQPGVGPGPATQTEVELQQRVRQEVMNQTRQAQIPDSFAAEALDVDPTLDASMITALWRQLSEQEKREYREAGSNRRTVTTPSPERSTHHRIGGL